MEAIFTNPNRTLIVTSGGSAIYAFAISNSGIYTVAANVNAPSDGANSFYVNIDAQPTDPTMIWDVPVTSGFTNQIVSWRGDETDNNSAVRAKNVQPYCWHT